MENIDDIEDIVNNCIKIEEGVGYFKKMPDWARKRYYIAIKGKCQLCQKNLLLNEMEVHRIKRGYKKGYYTVCPLNHPKQNCKFLCKSCHKALHSNEPNIRRK
jgi:hypothetical protein